MINDLPIYDTEILPALSYPATITQRERKYLGGRTVKGDLVISISYQSDGKEEMTSLYNFWKDDCDAGGKLFIIKGFNLFGISEDMAVEWASDVSGSWSSYRVFKGKFTFIARYKVDENNELIEI